MKRAIVVIGALLALPLLGAPTIWNGAKPAPTTNSGHLANWGNHGPYERTNPNRPVPTNGPHVTPDNPVMMNRVNPSGHITGVASAPTGVGRSSVMVKQ